MIVLSFIFLCSLFSNAGTSDPDGMWTYKTVEGKELKLSVFLPEGYENSTESYPTMVWVHGGSWNAGDPDWQYPDCAYWKKRGMVAVSVDYRLKTRDQVEVPLECVKDLKSAIRFLRMNAEKLKINPDKIVVSGDSAGGQMAASLPTILDPKTNDDCFDLSISCIPNAVVLTNPYFKCPTELSPPDHLTKSLPPCITFLGDQDKAITVESLLKFHEALRSLGNDSEYYVGIGGKHGFCNGRDPKNPFFYWSVEKTDAFLVSHGILSGNSVVKVPEGVKVLVEGEDYKAFR